MKYRAFTGTILLLVIVCFASLIAGTDETLLEQIRHLREVQTEKVELTLTIKQPLFHHHPEKGTFQQRLILKHVGFDRPMVLVTEGYALRKNYCEELSELLDANQLRVEHRFFGESQPDSLVWEALNIQEAAADHHRIVQLFKKLYNGPWINTGWSKGGQTALIHKRFYPEDIAATVAYDAPINFDEEDPRIVAFFEKVGTPECREKIRRFQRLVLKHKDEIIPMVENYASLKGYRFSIGYEKALEYVVLEYPFSFWQYHHIPCEEIPGPEQTPWQWFEHLRHVVAFSSYSDRAMNSASMYQFITQLGYYAYPMKGLPDLLSDGSNYPNRRFAPNYQELKYDPTVMRDVQDWLEKHGDRIIAIYGAQDPWSAPQLNLPPEREYLKKILPDGNHYTFIRTFPEEEQSEILNLLKKWINLR